jgi:ATP phosphoribosyltransferase regulatory subunit
MAAAHTEAALPLRLCYFGNAFRQRAQGSGQPHEIWQAGFELLGVQSPSADAEALTMGLASLRGIGIKDVTACIGYPAITCALNAAVGRLPPLTVPDLLEGMDRWFEPADPRHIAHLKALAALLLEQGQADSFVFDVSLAREMTYYSGPVFEIYSTSATAPVAGGGRYDGLCSSFGRVLAATGLAIDVLEVMAVLRKGSESVRKLLEGTLIGYEEGAAGMAGKMAASLRKTGRIAELDPLSRDPECLLIAAKAKHREVALFVTRQGYQEYAVAGEPDELGRRSTGYSLAGVH